MDPQPLEAPSLASLIGHLATDLAAADSGTRAELRRLTPDDPGGPAFWRVVVTRLEPADQLRGGGPARENALRRWAVILRALAGFGHQPGRRFGSALAIGGVSELRLNRLLRTSDEALFDQLRAVSHQLIHAAVPVDLTGLALLLLSDGQPNQTAVRQGIANDYYQQVFAAEKEK